MGVGIMSAENSRFQGIYYFKKDYLQDFSPIYLVICGEILGVRMQDGCNNDATKTYLQVPGDRFSPLYSALRKDPLLFVPLFAVVNSEAPAQMRVHVY